MVAAAKLINKSITPIFTELGESIRYNWARYNYLEDALPETASEILEKFKLHQQITPSDIIDHALRPDPMLSSHQMDSPFGDLQQITYRHAKFFIEVLYWTDGATGIHDHGFSGAFYVMHGSSINAEYHFEKSNKINHHFSFGQLSKPNISKLSTGSIKAILSGGRFIHSVFHLENPTISVVIRTHQDDDAMPQFEYRGSKIRLVKEFSPEFAKQVQALKFVLSTNNEKFINSFSKIYHNAPLDERYWLIRAFYTNLLKIPVLWQSINNMGDEQTQSIIESVGEEALLSRVISIRAQIQDEELRYFIALLMNLPTWNEVISFIENYYHNEPQQVVHRCFEKLTALGHNVPKVNELYRCKNFEIITNENALGQLIKNKLFSK